MATASVMLAYFSYGVMEILTNPPPLTAHSVAPSTERTNGMVSRRCAASAASAAPLSRTAPAWTSNPHPSPASGITPR